MRNLNNIFKTNNRQAQRRVLDKFDISKEDKNKTLNELNNSNGGGSVSKYAPRYFKIDWDKATDGWKYILTLGDAKNGNFDNLYIFIGSTCKQFINLEGKKDILITAYPSINLSEYSISEFSYNPIYVPQDIKDSYNIPIKIGFYSFEDVVEYMPMILEALLSKSLTLSMEGITEITEDEYYKID